jgi:phosphoglycerate dehydrogenase-like enzyme
LKWEVCPPTMADVDEVLAAADVLAVLLPLILATRGLAGCCERAAVKSTAIG